MRRTQESSAGDKKIRKVPKSRPKVPAETARAVMLESGHRCAVCGESCPLERAHIVPWRVSKTHKIEDLICLCANCHQRADLENWGQKVLRDYKKRPWIHRKLTEQSMVETASSRIVLTLEMDLDQFNEKHEQLLVYALAAFLDISPKAISVSTVEEGSVRITLKLERTHAERLLDSAKNLDPALKEYLDPFKVTHISGELTQQDHVISQKLNERRRSGRKIYVGNLPFHATEDEIRKLFAQFGTVSSVTLITDRDTGSPRGFGFVEMDDGGGEAIEALDNRELGGRNLRVNEAVPREDGRQQRSRK